MAIGILTIRHAPMSEPQKYTSPRTRKVGTPMLTVSCEEIGYY